MSSMNNKSSGFWGIFTNDPVQDAAGSETLKAVETLFKNYNKNAGSFMSADQLALPQDNSEVTAYQPQSFTAENESSYEADSGQSGGRQSEYNWIMQQPWESVSDGVNFSKSLEKSAEPVSARNVEKSPEELWLRSGALLKRENSGGGKSEAAYMPEFEFDYTYGRNEGQYKKHKEFFSRYPEFAEVLSRQPDSKDEVHTFFPDYFYEDKLRDIYRIAEEMRKRDLVLKEQYALQREIDRLTDNEGLFQGEWEDGVRPQGESGSILFSWDEDVLIRSMQAKVGSEDEAATEVGGEGAAALNEGYSMSGTGYTAATGDYYMNDEEKGNEGESNVLVNEGKHLEELKVENAQSDSKGEERLTEINNSVKKQALSDFTLLMNTKKFTDAKELRKSNIHIISYAAIKPDEEIDEALNSAKQYFASDDNRQEMKRLIAEFPEVFKNLRDVYGVYPDNDLLFETCAMIKVCEKLKLEVPDSFSKTRTTSQESLERYFSKLEEKNRVWWDYVYIDRDYAKIMWKNIVDGVYRAMVKNHEVFDIDLLHNPELDKKIEEVTEKFLSMKTDELNGLNKNNIGLIYDEYIYLLKRSIMEELPSVVVENTAIDKINIYNQLIDQCSQNVVDNKKIIFDASIPENNEKSVLSLLDISKNFGIEYDTDFTQYDFSKYPEIKNIISNFAVTHNVSYNEAEKQVRLGIMAMVNRDGSSDYAEEILDKYKDIKEKAMEENNQKLPLVMGLLIANRNLDEYVKRAKKTLNDTVGAKTKYEENKKTLEMSLEEMKADKLRRVLFEGCKNEREEKLLYEAVMLIAKKQDKIYKKENDVGIRMMNIIINDEDNGNNEVSGLDEESMSFENREAAFQENSESEKENGVNAADGYKQNNNEIEKSKLKNIEISMFKAKDDFRGGHLDVKVNRKGMISKIVLINTNKINKNNINNNNDFESTEKRNKRTDSGYVAELHDENARFACVFLQYINMLNKKETNYRDNNIKDIEVYLNRFTNRNDGMSLHDFMSLVEYRYKKIKTEEENKNCNDTYLLSESVFYLVKNMRNNVDVNARLMGVEIANDMVLKDPTRDGVYYSEKYGIPQVQIRDESGIHDLTGTYAVMVKNMEQQYLILKNQGAVRPHVFYENSDLLINVLSEVGVSQKEFNKMFNENLRRLGVDDNDNNFDVQKGILAFANSLYKVQQKQEKLEAENKTVFTTMSENFENTSEEIIKSDNFNPDAKFNQENAIIRATYYYLWFKEKMNENINFYNKGIFAKNYRDEIAQEIAKLFAGNNDNMVTNEHIFNIVKDKLKSVISEYKDEESVMEQGAKIINIVDNETGKKAYEQELNIKDMSIQKGVDAVGELVAGLKSGEKISEEQLIKIILGNTSLPQEDCEKIYMKCLKLVRSYDVSKEARGLKSRYTGIDELLVNKSIPNYNKILAALITLDRASERLEFDKRYSDFKSKPVASYELATEMCEMSQEAMENKYSILFSDCKTTDERQEIYQANKKFAIVLKEKYKYDKEQAEKIMKMVYGDDMFYNLDAAVKVAVLKIGALFDDTLIEEIDKVKSAAELADRMRYPDSKVRQYFNGLVRDHLVEAGLIVMSVLIPGGEIKEVLNGIKKIVGYAGNYANVVSTYKKLVALGATKEQIVLGVSMELTAQKLKAMRSGTARRFFEGLSLNLGTSKNTAEMIGGGGSIGVSELAKYSLSGSNGNDDNK